MRSFCHSCMLLNLSVVIFFHFYLKLVLAINECLLSVNSLLVEGMEELNAATEAISRKMSHNCAMPFHELTLLASDYSSSWPWEHPLPRGKQVALSSSQMTSALQKSSPNIPYTIRLFNFIASCFVQLFGKHSYACRLRNGLAFSRQMPVARTDEIDRLYPI